MKTGIEFNPELPGLVAKIEEREAAVFSNYTWTEWRELTNWEKAQGIAHYRLHQLIKSHQEDAIARELKRKHQAASQG